MSQPGSVREVLIAEALGDLANLLDRAEALQAAMLESNQGFLDARTELADQLAAFESHVAALTEKAKVQAVRHILARTDEAARRSVDTQTRAMADAAQALFRAEIDPALQRLASPLRQWMERVERPWHQWPTHAATSAAASALTWLLAAWMWGR